MNADQFDELASDFEAVTRLELRAGGADADRAGLHARVGLKSSLQPPGVPARLQRADHLQRGRHAGGAAADQMNQEAVPVKVRRHRPGGEDATVTTGTAGAVEGQAREEVPQAVPPEGLPRSSEREGAPNQYSNRSVERKTVRIEKAKARGGAKAKAHTNNGRGVATAALLVAQVPPLRVRPAGGAPPCGARLRPRRLPPHRPPRLRPVRSHTARCRHRRPTPSRSG